MALTLTPAYGRDYKSKKAVVQDWEDGKDFIIADMFNPYDGKAFNKQSALDSGERTVNIRYKKLTQIAVIKVRKG